MPSPKPAVSIRRPPPTPAPADVERFVQGDRPANVQPLKRPDVQTSEPAKGPGLVKRKDGRTRRRTTVYFPPELGKRLAVHCVNEGIELSEAVTAAVTAYLESAKA